MQNELGLDLHERIFRLPAPFQFWEIMKKKQIYLKLIQDVKG